jgi:hypothetical protein
MDTAGALILGVFATLALGLTIAALALKSGRSILGFAGAGAWLLLGVYAYTNSTALWDIYYALFWLSIGMVIACSLVASILKEQKEIEGDIYPEELHPEDRELYDEMQSRNRERRRLEILYGKPSKHKSKSNSNFAETGIIEVKHKKAKY